MASTFSSIVRRNALPVAAAVASTFAPTVRRNALPVAAAVAPTFAPTVRRDVEGIDRAERRLPLRW